MKVFLDANVIVSVLNKEYPLFSFSSRILSLADRREFRLYTSPLCLAIAFYFAEKKSSTRVAREKIGMLANHLGVTAIDAGVVKEALANKKVKDVEDGMEYYSALASGCECIVSEDVGDFYFSGIEVINCEHFCTKYMRGKR